MKNWQLQDAKAHFSELIRNADSEGPQRVTVRSKPVAVVISIRDFQKLIAKPQPSFVDFMCRSPLKGLSLDLKRDKSLCRDKEKIGI